MESDNLKNTNPKDLIGSDKLPLHLFPESAVIYGALALLDGALKYGRANWRAAGVRASIYYDALTRHLTKWFEGEDIDPDSGLPHLAHAIACIAILIDAKTANKLKDDRMYPGNYTTLVKEMTAHVKRLKEIHKDKNPKHWTIADKNDRPEIETGGLPSFIIDGRCHIEETFATCNLGYACDACPYNKKENK